MEDTASLLQIEDKTRMPPLHQKRIVAFINHFLINTCGFLNDFAKKCENKFITLERKMQKIEAALIILEEKLDSVPATKIPNSQSTAIPQSQTVFTPVKVNESRSQAEFPLASSKEQTSGYDAVEKSSSGVRACDDSRYRKFFKMVQFGVPAQAVKLKMHSEGIENIDVLDTPNLLLPDGIHYVEPEL